MTVTMKDIRAALDPEEPDYLEAAALGPEALPHLDALVTSGDQMLASKATYLASLINDPRSAEIVAKAAQSDNPVVRVAAASAAPNLAAPGANAVLEVLIADTDPGVRKVARAAAPNIPGAERGARPEMLKTSSEASRPAPLVFGLMPGETAASEGDTVRSTMPGELPDAMPGERQEMPRR